MKETLDLRGLNFEEGYIAVMDKPLSWTSTDVVRKIKSALRRLGYRKKSKVGHAGTLDPLASGILLVCIGRATKMVDALQAEEKEYVADVMLGATTPSHDLEHEIDRTYPWGAHHAGSGRRKPSPRSPASGSKPRPSTRPRRSTGAHGLRTGPRRREVAVRQALINIYEMEIVEYDLPRIRIRVRCSKGHLHSFAGPRDRDRRSAAGRTSPRCAARAAADFTLEKSYELDEFLENLQKLETK